MVCKMSNLLKLYCSSIYLNQFRCVNFLFTHHPHHLLGSRLNLSSYTSFAARVSTPALSEGLVILDERPTTFMSSYSHSFPPNPLLNRKGQLNSEIVPVIDEKFRLHLENKTPSQMIETLRAYRYLIDLVRFRTFILQISLFPIIHDYHVTLEQFEFLHEMFKSFPEMVNDLSNLPDVSLFLSRVRVSSEIPCITYIANQIVKKIDDMTLDQAYVFYKSLQAVRTALTVAGEPNPQSNLNLLNDDIIRARYLLISSIAFRIETQLFDETDINSLCEIFRIINRELYSKEAVDTLVKSIVSTKCYMKSKNATDVIAGFTSFHGSKILKEVFNSGDREAIKLYTDLIDTSILSTGRLTIIQKEPTSKPNRYIADCFIRMLLQEGDHFTSISFWRSFLEEIDFNRHKLDLIGLQNLLTLVNRFRIYCPFIIDSFAPIMIKNAAAYLEDDNISPIPFIYLMSECYHKPLNVNWNKFMRVLLHPKKLVEIPIDRTLAVISRLAILEEYESVRNFEMERVKMSLTSFKSVPQAKRLLTFYSGLMCESSDMIQKWSFRRECGSVMSRSIIVLDKATRIGPFSPLQPILETAFGGPQFVINGVWTKTGVLMSHLLVFRRGEYPVAIRNIDENSDSKLTYLNDISIPPEGTVVAIVPAHRYYYTNHSRNLRGKIQFQLRLIRKLGIIPVVADIAEFESKSIHERTHWLVTKIRRKITENKSDAWEFWR